MKATMLDLRFKTKKILQALRNNEEVRLFFRGKETGLILPLRSMKFLSSAAHPYFGSVGKSEETVPQVMRRLRGPRHSA